MLVTVQDDEGNILAEVDITHLDNMYSPNPLGLYQVRYAVIRDTQMTGLHQRRLSGFERFRFNALGLVKAALDLLGDEELELEPGAIPADSPDLQRSRLPLRNPLRKLLGG